MISLKTNIETIVNQLSRHKKTLFFIFTIFSGVIILWPLHNFQYSLAQGDHGRDLYCFQKTMEGALPYRDFSWLYGPLMPYYYSIFYLLGGISIQSILLGQGLLILLVGIFTYLACAVFLSPTMAFLCAVWYWSFRGVEFFYTYNHIGGILAIIITLYYLLKYIRYNQLSSACAGFVSIFLLLLIRLNMGVAILVAFVSSLFLADIVQKNLESYKRRRIYMYCSFALLAGTSLIYWFLLYPLPDYAIYQSFPFGKSQRTDISPTLLDALRFTWQIITSYFTASLAQIIFGLLIILSAAQSVLLIFSNKLPRKTKKRLMLVFGSLSLFAIFTSHEFIVSGTFFRIFWILPILYITLFYLIATATKNVTSPTLKILIRLTLFLPCLWNVQHAHRTIAFYKKPAHLLHIGKNKIYTTQHPAWFKTITDVTTFIKHNVPAGKKIFTLPFDPLYLYLSERDSGARQLVFFEHINITPEQERETIAELENTKTNWIILSNRSVSSDKGMGTFGKTYCLLLAEYINSHFTAVAQAGDWVNEPGWAWHHGVRILKRIK